MLLDSVLMYGSKVTLFAADRKDQAMSDAKGRAALVAGGLAALLASACCLGPLVLVTIGVSGAWIGNLTALEPYRPFFLGAALVAMVLAYRRIFGPAQKCKPGEVCAVPQVRRTYRVVFWIVAALVLVALAFPYVLPLLY
jgi:mercuric ion transport protein